MATSTALKISSNKRKWTFLSCCLSFRHCSKQRMGDTFYIYNPHSQFLPPSRKIEIRGHFSPVFCHCTVSEVEVYSVCIQKSMENGILFISILPIKGVGRFGPWFKRERDFGPVSRDWQEIQCFQRLTGDPVFPEIDKRLIQQYAFLKRQSNGTFDL